MRGRWTLRQCCPVGQSHSPWQPPAWRGVLELSPVSASSCLIFQYCFFKHCSRLTERIWMLLIQYLSKSSQIWIKWTSSILRHLIFIFIKLGKVSKASSRPFTSLSSAVLFPAPPPLDPSEHTCACTRVHTHTRTLAHSKRERNKNFLPPLLVKQFHLNWPSSLRDLQDGSESDGGRIRQIRKQRGRLGGELQGLLSLAPLNIFPLLWSNVCII